MTAVALLYSWFSAKILFSSIFSFFFFNDTATTEIYTLSLHDALPIYIWGPNATGVLSNCTHGWASMVRNLDRKSTRLNSSHGYISYAVFCLKKKKKTHSTPVVLTTRCTVRPLPHASAAAG